MRPKKAQAQIAQGYISLLQELKSSRKITIQDVARRSGVSRSTIYTYYNSLEEISNDALDILLRPVLEAIVEGHRNVSARKGYEQIYTVMLRYFKRNTELADALLFNISNSQMADYISTTFQTFLTEYYKERGENISSRILSATALFWSNGIYALIKEWAQSGYAASPAEMASLICDAIETTGKFFQNR